MSRRGSCQVFLYEREAGTACEKGVYEDQASKQYPDKKNLIQSRNSSDLVHRY